MNPQARSQRMQPICRLLFLFILIAIAFSPTVSTSAQMGNQTSARITIKPRTNPIQINQETWVDIILPATSNMATQSKMSSDVTLTITLTTLSDLASAKKGAEWQTNSKLEWDSLALKAARDGQTNEASVIQGRLPAGRTSFTIKVRSERAGVLNLFVEGIGASSTRINVYGPSQFDVKLNPAVVRAGREAQLNLSLLDYQGKTSTSNRNLPVTVTITTLENLSEARQTRAAQPRVLDKALIALPKGARTARISGVFPSGKDRISLRFRTDAGGVVRIFVESLGMATSSTLISAIAQTSQPFQIKDSTTLLSSFLRPASYSQDANPVTPTAKGRLQINRINSNAVAGIAAGTYEFIVTLEKNSRQELVLPASDIAIVFKSDSNAQIAPTFYPPDVIIPAGTNSSGNVRVSYGCKNRMSLVAQTEMKGIEPSDPSDQKASFDFSPYRRMGKLILDADPPKELADGRKAITLRVKALDACGDEIKSQDESLDMGERIVDFTARPPVRFDQGNSLAIPANESRAEKKIYPISFSMVEITATSTRDIKTLPRTVLFYFPFWQLIFAIFGGLVCCPLICLVNKQVPQLFSGSSRRQGVSWVSIFGVRWGVLLCGTVLTAILGGVLYGFLFYGALSASDPQVEKSSWGKTIVSILMRLSTQDYFASWLMGLLGSAALMILFGLALKGWRWRRSSTGNTDGEPPLNEAV